VRCCNRQLLQRVPVPATCTAAADQDSSPRAAAEFDHPATAPQLDGSGPLPPAAGALAQCDELLAILQLVELHPQQPGHLRGSYGNPVQHLSLLYGQVQVRHCLFMGHLGCWTMRTVNLVCDT